MSYRELRKLTDQEVEDLHDEGREQVQVGMQWFRDELHRRQEDRRLVAMVKLTWIIAGLTLINAILVAVTLWATIAE